MNMILKIVVKVKLNSESEKTRRYFIRFNYLTAWREQLRPQNKQVEANSVNITAIRVCFTAYINCPAVPVCECSLRVCLF